MVRGTGGGWPRMRSGLAVAEVDGRLPATVERTAYFVVAEALTNAVKHARAEKVTVTLERAPTRLVIGVTDDGVGGATQEGGAGLHGLADRVETLGGTLRVQSTPGRGERTRRLQPIFVQGL